MNDMKALSEAATQGEWETKFIKGWGTQPDNLCASSWEGGLKPIATFPISAAQYANHINEKTPDGGVVTSFRKKTDDEQSVADEMGAERQANMDFIAALVNAFRAGDLHTTADLQAAVAAEREACAGVADTMILHAADDIATVIRNRSQEGV